MILDVFLSGHKLICIRDLAKACGFESAASRDFKDGFNFLVDKKVVLLQQSGWSSERRNHSYGHLKTAMLVGDVFQVSSGTNLDFNIDMDKFIGLPDSIKDHVQSSLTVDELTESRKQLYRDCEMCKTNPIVFITSEQIGVCEKHWSALAYANIEW